MEYITCTTTGLESKRVNEMNHRLTNKHPAVTNEYYRQQCNKILMLADKGTHSNMKSRQTLKQPGLVKLLKKIQLSTVIVSKMSTAIMQKNTDFRINENLTGKVYDMNEQDTPQIDNIVAESVEDCLQYFSGFRYMCQ